MTNKSEQKTRRQRMDGLAARPLDSTLAWLGFSPPKHWRDTWELSAKDYAPGQIAFLQEDVVREGCTYLGLDQELCSAFSQAASLIRSNPEVERLAWHCHTLFFVHYREPEFYDWPMLPLELGVAAHMFYAVILLSGLPNVRAISRRRHIPEKVMADTFADFCPRMRQYQKKTGHWGLNDVAWMLRHFTGRIFQLGRLQFMFDSFRQDFRAFRNLDDRRVILLAEPGISFRADGQFDGVNGIYDPGVFTSTLDLRVKPIRGNPVTSDGRVLQQTVLLSWAQWIQILAPGDPTLSVHIPAGAKMDFSQCGESFRAAAAFFPKHFPERPCRAWTCDSWLLDPHFAKLLPPDANIARFQRELYLHPVRGRNEGVMRQAFGMASVDPRIAPRDNSLRRAVLQHLEHGGLWVGGGAILFPDDLDWGREVYHRQSSLP